MAARRFSLMTGFSFPISVPIRLSGCSRNTCTSYLFMLFFFGKKLYLLRGIIFSSGKKRKILTFFIVSGRLAAF